MWVVGSIVISERQLPRPCAQPDEGMTEPLSGGSQRLVAGRRSESGGGTDQVRQHEAILTECRGYYPAIKIPPGVYGIFLCDNHGCSPPVRFPEPESRVPNPITIDMSLG